MSIADEKYKELVLDIYENGSWDYGQDVRGKYEDGNPAYSKSVFGRQVKFEKGELPILNSKHVGNVTAFKEVFLFWIMQTTKAADFEALNVPIWREWYKVIDGELGLGRSYGYQLKKFKQVEGLLEQLKNNPASKRHLVSYWNAEDVQFKALMECVWGIQFNIQNGNLDLLLVQRSVDVPLGLPYNWSQYYQLQNVIAHVNGLEVGTFTHQMGNMHYYDRQEETLLKQINSPTFEQPSIWINKEKTDFFDFTPKDIKVENYKNGGKFEYEVTI